MRNLVAVMTVLTIAAAGAVGAGDDIKWSKSKKIEYVSTDDDPAPFDKTAEDYINKYYVSWAPYTNNLIDRIQIYYYGWDFLCGKLNYQLRTGEITAAEYESEVRKQRKLCRKYLKFEIRIRFKNEDFYERADEDYWRMYVRGPGGEREVISCEAESALEGELQTYIVGSTSVGMVPAGDYYFERYFTVMFENPYADIEGPPPSLQLVMECDECRRGFEWRFKND